MKTQIIKAIFTNLLFTIGVVLVVVGFVSGASVVVKSLVFDEYPLNNYEEQKCEAAFAVRPAVEVVGGKGLNSLSKEEQEEIKQKCFSSLEKERKIKQVEDVTRSISFLVSGFALTLIFRRFIFSKGRVS